MAEADASWVDVIRHDVAMATVRAFAEGSHAVRVVVLVDPGGGAEPPLVECETGSAVTITSGDETYLMPDEVLDRVEPLAVAPAPAVPASAITVDAVTGEVAAPLGAIAAMADAVRDLARALGGRSVATADFATRSGEPLTIAARDGDPLLLAYGDQQFELPDA